MLKNLAALSLAVALSSSCALVYDYDGYRGRHDVGVGGAGGGSAPACECPPPPDTECAKYSCDATPGKCVATFAPSGTTVTQAPPAGYCHRNACDGAGNVVTLVDGTVVRPDGNECTSDVCLNDAPENQPVNDGTSCGTIPGLSCHAGKCVGCTKDMDCTQTSECQIPHCSSPGAMGTCDSIPAADGTQCMSTGQCVSGSCHECFLATNCPAKACNSVACVQGTCIYTADAPFAACNDGAAGFCYSGGCRHCQTQNDCISYQGGCCNGGVCSGPPSCDDGCRDGGETGVDCGSALCGKCPNDPCASGADCHTKFCNVAYGNVCTSCALGVSQPCDSGTCNAATGFCP